MIGLLLTRWKWGLGLFGALAFLGMAGGFAWAWQGWAAEKAHRDRDRASYDAGQAKAKAKALADARARETALQAHTAQIEDERNDLQERFAALADKYRAANRLRVGPAQGDAGNVPATAEDHGTGLRAPASEAALVVITDDDFDRCTVIAGDYVKLREWALSLTK